MEAKNEALANNGSNLWHDLKVAIDIKGDIYLAVSLLSGPGIILFAMV